MRLSDPVLTLTNLVVMLLPERASCINPRSETRINLTMTVKGLTGIANWRRRCSRG